MDTSMSKSNNMSPLPLGGDGGRLSVGILGAAGYTGGELIRLLLNHPEAEIVFANSESNAGNLVSDVHEGLLGDTELRFSSEMPFGDVDVVFFCFGHGKSRAFLSEHAVPQGVKIIDLAQDFRVDHEFYGKDNRAYDFSLRNVGSWNWGRYRTRANTRGEADSDSLYVSDNGASVATGRFAKALKKIAGK